MAGEFVDILIFAVLAAVIFFKLFNVLGRRTGNEQPPPRPGPVADNDDQETILPFRRQEDDQAVDTTDPLMSGLDRIGLADRSFDPEQFLAGAKTAFEFIIDAFHQGELEPVRPYLDEDVYRSFADALAQRNMEGTRRHVELVAINQCTVIEAEMAGRQARITVRFESEQIDVVKDSEERIIAGDPSGTIEVTDIWTFARDTGSRNPNWHLVATRSPA